MEVTDRLDRLEAIARASVLAGKPVNRLLPTRAYPDPSERVMIRDYKYPQLTEGGVGLSAESRYFLAAVAQGFVVDSPEGFETLLAWFGMGQMDHNGPTALGQHIAANEEPFVAFAAWTESWQRAEGAGDHS